VITIVKLVVVEAVRKVEIAPAISKGGLCPSFPQLLARRFIHFSSFSPFFLRMESPRISMRCALCTSRSRIPSASVDLHLFVPAGTLAAAKSGSSSASGSDPRRSPEVSPLRFRHRGHDPVIDDQNIDPVHPPQQLPQTAIGTCQVQIPEQRRRPRVVDR